MTNVSSLNLEELKEQKELWIEAGLEHREHFYDIVMTLGEDFEPDITTSRKYKKIVGEYDVQVPGEYANRTVTRGIEMWASEHIDTLDAHYTNIKRSIRVNIFVPEEGKEFYTVMFFEWIDQYYGGMRHGESAINHGLNVFIPGAWLECIQKDLYPQYDEIVRIGKTTAEKAERERLLKDLLDGVQV